MGFMIMKITASILQTHDKKISIVMEKEMHVMILMTILFLMQKIIVQ
jgi:hypothetical protein